LDSVYAKDTYRLADKIQQYATADPYDPERVKLSKELKAEGPAWVSKYARGGSVRSPSARRFYVLVDQVSGHLVSNGWDRAKGGVWNIMIGAFVSAWLLFAH
jgi:hypothetical protein